MANSYFNFKQFTVHQENCAMKVCTDACILGAWFSSRLQSDNISTILDIGSGTGLQMLMLAQNHKVDIHGIEIDEPAFEQLNKNLNDSKWREQFTSFKGDVRHYNFPVQYDFIISNPPFFAGDLTSSDPRKNAAKHSTTLTLQDLFKSVSLNMSSAGKFGLLIPWDRTDETIKTAEAFGMYLNETLRIKQTPRHNWFRSILLFSYTSTPQQEFQLTIKSDQLEIDQYQILFSELLSPYYLRL